MTPDEMKAVAWKFFLSQGLTEEGTAGLMGNLVAESAGFYPNRVEFLCLKRLKEVGRIYTDATYTAFVDDGTISRAEFLNPLPGRQYGYGLAQWTTPARKGGLYDLCKARNVSIADLRTQLDYLMYELKTSYKSLLARLQSTHDIMDASTSVLTKFEQPADVGYTVRKARYDYSVQVFDTFHKEESAVRAEDLLNVARAWIGLKEADGSHMQVVEVYNAYTPRARGYALTPRDSWCDAFVSACFIKAGAVSLIGGTECGVEEHVKIFQKKGIWNEDGKAVPGPGWIIVYNWDKNTQPNDGYSDHIGIVEKCNGKTITVIEGNYRDAVARREIPVGWGYIRGYAVPEYAKEEAMVYYVRSSWIDTGSQTYKGTDFAKAKKAAQKSKQLYVFDQDGRILYPSHTTAKARIERAVLWANAVANDKRHGYDNREGYRWGQHGDYACSSLVITAYDQAGVPVRAKGANVTADMYKAFLAAGFADVTDKVDFRTCAGMVRGDVLLSPGKHTEIYIGSGRLIGARGVADSGHAENWKPGDQTGGEITKSAYYNLPWLICLRYVGLSKDTVVQCGSYEQKGNAATLQKRITDKTKIQMVVVKVGEWYTVRTKGMTRDDAKKVQAQLLKAGFDAILI